MGKFIDETGNKYDRLVVLYRVPNTSPIKWHCKCECGKETDVLGTALRNGNTKSCGCLQKQRAIESNKKRSTLIVNVGQKFNSLTALEIDGGQVKCRCDCGKEIWIEKSKLISGHNKSCGCHINQIPSNFKNEIGNKYGKLLVMDYIGQSKEGRSLWECICDCGNTKIATGKSLRGGFVKSCGCIHSFGEQKIAEILTNLNIKYTRQKTFDDLLSPDTNYHLYFDFFIEEYNIAIEYQGEQHYLCNGRGWNTEKNFLELSTRDQIKRKYCKKNGIKLIEIPYTDFNKININYIKELIL